MKRFSLTVAFVLLLAHPLTMLAQNPGDSVFAGTQVHTINIIFPQPNYWDSLTIYYSQGNEQYIPATVIANGVTYDSVGVRLKGNSSYSHPNNKKSIRLSFDEYRSGQRWDGLKGIHLNNCWGDPTFMREKLHLDFCRDAGIRAPRGNYAEVYFNGSLWAFYSMVEHVDKPFLNTRYNDNSGDLFKANDGFGGGNPQVSDFRWYGSTHSTYYTRYEMKTEESTTAWDNLVTLLDSVNNSTNPATAMPAKINLNPLYRAIATDNLFANLDSYINPVRNFYFYFHPVTGKMEWIVWDVSLSFGAYTGGVSNLEALSVTYVSSATNRPLAGKIMNTTTLRNDYLRQLCLLKNTYFSSTRLFPIIDSIANTIRPYVYADPRKMYTTTQFETNIVSDINASGGGGTRKPGLKSFINLRQASVTTQLNNLGVNCALAALPGDVVINEFMASNSSIPDSSGEFDDWIEFRNNTTGPVDLGGMYLSDDPAMPTKWQFPANTIIAPEGYLIVWADNDTGQAGLHANFALSASGEHLRFSNTDASVLDSITFGPQTTDRTMARFPNGTGPFFEAYPTFNANNGSSIVVNPVLTTPILPRYIQGLNGTNTNRIPYAYRARLTGLLPNAAYRYINQVVTSSDLPSVNGAGNCIYAQASGNFVRTTGPSIATAGAYGIFETDGAGEYEGWFITEPSGNARFVPGAHLFMRIILNDGMGGNTVATRLTTADSVQVVNLESGAGAGNGTGLRGNSLANPKDFVFVYDNTDGSGRPVSGTFVESDGTANTTGNNYAAFYGNNVNAIDGAFGLVLPNDLPVGVLRVERRSLLTGDVEAVATDADGVWPSGANTVNPSGGTTEIVLEGSDVRQLAAVYFAHPSPIGFGTVLVSSSATDSIVVKNIGAGALTITSIMSSDLLTFSTGEGTPIVIEPGDSAVIHVVFHPTSPGSHSGVLTFSHNGASSPDTIHCSGNALSSASTTVNTGWNMISNPVTTTNDSVRQLFPTSLFNYAFSFNVSSGYAQSYTMENGVGYWGKFPGEMQVYFGGDPRLTDTLHVAAGWNMVGTITVPVDTGDVVSIPSDLRVSDWFLFDGGYQPVTQLLPGKAYWVKASGAGVFIIDEGTSAAEPMKGK